MAESLDPEVLAEGERLWERYRLGAWTAPLGVGDWLQDNGATLLAIARDHARLTAGIAEALKWTDSGGECGQRLHNLLSAEAGDRVAWMDEVAEAAYPSAEAGDTAEFRSPTSNPAPVTDNLPISGRSAETGDTDG